MASSIAEDVRDRLAANLTIQAMWPGGVYVEHDPSAVAAGATPPWDEKGGYIHPLDPKLTPGAWESVGASGVKRLRPCAVLGESSTVPTGPRNRHDAITIRLGMYQEAGFTAIRDGLAIARAILHETHGQLTEGQYADRYYWIEFLDIPLQGQEEPSLPTADGRRGASYELARFTALMEVS